MIQFNLLTDVKLEYIRARRERRLVVSISVIAVAVSVGLLILVFTIGAFQKKHLSDLTDDITSESKGLQEKPQINKILTVQNQLQKLVGLHDAKPAVPRLFGYFNELTPADTGITSLDIDYNAHTIKIEGVADALSTVNKYADTLKFTTFAITGGGDTAAAVAGNKAFSDVVLSSFGVASQEKDQRGAAAKVTFTLTVAYEPTIFDITKEVKLIIPKLVSTRSQVLQPTDLFTAPIENSTNGGGQ